MLVLLGTQTPAKTPYHGDPVHQVFGQGSSWCHAPEFLPCSRRHALHRRWCAVRRQGPGSPIQSLEPTRRRRPPRAGNLEVHSGESQVSWLRQLDAQFRHLWVLFFRWNGRPQVTVEAFLDSTMEFLLQNLLTFAAKAMQATDGGLDGWT